MTSFIAVPAEVVPLLYSGIESVRTWTAGKHQPTARPRRAESVKHSRVGGPSLRAVLCDPPANHHPHNGKNGG